MSITATTQKSRFHAETLDDGSRDVDLKGLTLLVDDAELLADAHLRLVAGRRYGLVGRNGVGKSTLLRAMGDRLIVGFPRQLRCLYVDQLEGVDSALTPVQLVVQADREAARAAEDAANLQAAAEAGDPAGLAHALRHLELAKLRDEAAEARRVAERRSRLRGLKAREDWVAAEAALAQAQARLDEPVAAKELERATEAAHDLLNELFEKLSLRGPEQAEAEARSILAGLLCLSLEQQDSPVGQLSGGWRIRVALAQALFLRPDILLLDEPTNHLDLPGIIWLQRYLRKLEDTTVVVVSHDRAFLNAVTEEIILFKKGTLRYFSGNYDDYLQQTEERQLHQQRLAEGIEKKKAHMERSIQEGLKQARKHGDDKKLSMVASRRAKLEDRLGVERNAAGHRLRVNKDFVGYFETSRQQADVEAQDSVPAWKVLQPVELRHKGPLIQVEAVSCGYRRSRPVLTGVTFRLDQGEHMALVGPNGQGKTTLVRTIVGELAPLAGTVQLHSSAVVSYFQQTQVDELSARAQGSPLSYMQERWPAAHEKELRNHLGSFGLGPIASQPLPTLSGGQTVRVALAAAFFARPNLLILDEPSNHLDLEALDCLLAALQQFAGGVLLVSHDQYLVDEAVERVCLVSGGALQPLEGGVAEYVQQLSCRKKSRAAAGAGSSSADKGSKKQPSAPRGVGAKQGGSRKGV